MKKRITNREVFRSWTGMILIFFLVGVTSGPVCANPPGSGPDLGTDLVVPDAGTGDESVGGDYGPGNGGPGAFVPLSDETWEIQLLEFFQYGVSEEASGVFNMHMDQTREDVACVNLCGCFDIRNKEVFEALTGPGRNGFFGFGFNSRAKKLTAAELLLQFDGLSLLTKKKQSGGNHERERCPVRAPRHSWVWSLSFPATYVDLPGPTTHGGLPRHTNDEESGRGSSVPVYPDVNESFPNRRASIYSVNTLIAIGVINKLEEIREVDAEFAQSIERRLLELIWTQSGGPLKIIDDTGHIPIETKGLAQVAHREFGIVTTSVEGWSRRFFLKVQLDPESERKSEVEVLPMSIFHKVGAVYHEVVYDLLVEKHGDKTSKVARAVTGLLFKSPLGYGEQTIRAAIRIFSSDR
jgi:hypothetical protein